MAIAEQPEPLVSETPIPCFDSPALSPRDRQVRDLLSQGRLAKEIADELGIAKKTVEVFAGRVYAKTGMTLRELIVERARRDAEGPAAAADESLEQAERSIAEGLEKIREARGRLSGRSLRTASFCSFSAIGVVVVWMGLGGGMPRPATDQHKGISPPTKIVVNVGQEGEIIAIASIKRKVIHRIRPDGLNGHAEGIYPENRREFRSEAEIERALKDEGYRMAK